jgi:hypothetical protein
MKRWSDRETAALGRIIRALGPFGSGSRGRMLDYILRRYQEAAIPDTSERPVTKKPELNPMLDL